MSLSVYTVKHPLVMNWTSYLLHNELTTSDKFDIINKIGISLIYEATRKTTKINNLYLKEIHRIVEVNLLPYPINFFIFIDLHLAPILSKNIIDIIPQSEICTISNEIHESNIFTLPKTSPSNAHAQIILIKYNIDTTKTIQEINQLIALYPNIKLQDIQLCCFMCKTSTLQCLGNTYPSLNIYTTQIINDNNN